MEFNNTHARLNIPRRNFVAQVFLVCKSFLEKVRCQTRESISRTEFCAVSFVKRILKLVVLRGNMC